MHPPPAPAKMRAMGDVTQILSAIEQGDPKAADELLLPLVHTIRSQGLTELPARSAPFLE
jgi:DNA-binding GntR family transcriptional regulator